MTDRFRVVPAAYVVFRRHGDRGAQVLLQLRQGTGYMDGYWATAAAGHVEADESVLQAACREVLEELGVTVEDTDLRPLCGMHRTGRNSRPIDERVDFFFECWRWGGEPRLLEAGKAVDLQWFGLGELPALVVPHERFVLERLDDGLPAIVTFGF
ncbi:DNA mismatch repair protein MutT [Blastococcus sp. TF02-8]|uniref:NUDIX domain-containing protein n=1 Tax=Blastococcus sp. TF02-8 TaxID=2250574 RepID=UPI000DEB6FA4|nr:NUDIX domain-containing protein [Blastococcus sp. TF02-8]RBY95491.1 DNA mismatch repair protein MutT [Blastococcus sp. TF02-8]